VRKEAGFNAITMFHWSNWIAPQWAYDIADEEGMMIVQTIPMINRAVADAMWKEGLDIERLPVKGEVEGAIRLLRNRPSVVIYELSNELWSTGVQPQLVLLRPQGGLLPPSGLYRQPLRAPHLEGPFPSSRAKGWKGASWW